jgi:peptidyl-prolyl cis-trans isomerase D
LKYEAQKRGIKVTDEEVRERLKSYPFFLRDGRFDKYLYEDILRYSFRVGTHDFEEATRDDIMVNKLYEQITFPINVSDEETREQYKRENEKVQVNYALIPFDDFKNDSLFDEEEAQKYYQNNKNEFLLPAAINVDYVTFAVPEDADEQKKKDIAGQADAVYKELTQNPGLAEIAKTHNLTVESTGFFSREQPNLKIGWSFELLQRAFELEAGDFSEPMLTPQGYYILKLKEKRDAHIPEYEQAKDKVKEALITLKAKELARQKARELLSQTRQTLAGETHFQSAAESLGLTVTQTEPFTRGQYLPSIGISKDFQDLAFSLDPREPLADDVVETAKGYAIIHLDAYVPFDEKQFEVDKVAVTQQLTAKKKTEIFNEFLAALRLKANIQDYIAVPQENQ